MAAQIFYSLSECHSHWDFKPFNLIVRSHLVETLLLVMEHAAHLPRLHCRQASQRDTALLMVSLFLGRSQGPRCKANRNQAVQKRILRGRPEM